MVTANKVLRRLAAGLIPLVIVGAVLAIGAGSAAGRSAGNPIVYNQYGSSVPLRYCGNAACAVEYWIPNSTNVKMVCWWDSSQVSTGNYASRRWFIINVGTGPFHWETITGYVHSSYVYYQVTVPHC